MQGGISGARRGWRLMMDHVVLLESGPGGAGGQSQGTNWRSWGWGNQIRGGDLGSTPLESASEGGN